MTLKYIEHVECQRLLLGRQPQKVRSVDGQWAPTFKRAVHHFPREITCTCIAGKRLCLNVQAYQLPYLLLWLKS